MSFRKCATVLLGLVLLYIPLFSQGFDSKDPSIDSKDPSIAILLGNDGRAEHSKLLEDSGEDWETSLAWGKQLFFSGQAIDPPPGFQIKVKDYDGIETEEINAAKFLKKNPASPLAEFMKDRKTVKLSEHLSTVTEFTCNRCHNLGKEGDLLAVENPEDRYNFILKRNIKEGKRDIFMTPSPTLWGAVNREDFYLGKSNEIYRGLRIPNFFNEPVDNYDTENELEKANIAKPTKKGEIDPKGRVAIGAAVHICGSYCCVAKKDPAKPRDFFLKPWEYRALMTLFWENELRLSDLDLNKDELKKADQLKNELLKPNPDNSVVEPIQRILKTKFLTKADANPRTETSVAGNIKTGELLYFLSCARCHPGHGASVLGPAPRLQPNVHDKQKIQKAVDTLSHEFNNPTPYMPAFPKERLSAQQVEDIKAYILSLPN